MFKEIIKYIREISECSAIMDKDGVLMVYYNNVSEAIPVATKVAFKFKTIILVEEAAGDNIVLIIKNKGG